jgi:Protein of unknown function (DUF3955)
MNPSNPTPRPAKPSALKVLFPTRNASGIPSRPVRLLLRLAVLSVLAGIACMLWFRLSGSTVQADGVLKEPFYLLGIGWGLMIAAIASFVAALITHRLMERARR